MGKWKTSSIRGVRGFSTPAKRLKNNLESVLDESGPSYQANTARDKMMKWIEIDPQYWWFVGLRVLRITPSLVCIHIGPHNPQPTTLAMATKLYKLRSILGPEDISEIYANFSWKIDLDISSGLYSTQ